MNPETFVLNLEDLKNMCMKLVDMYYINMGISYDSEVVKPYVENASLILENLQTQKSCGKILDKIHSSMINDCLQRTIEGSCDECQILLPFIQEIYSLKKSL